MIKTSDQWQTVHRWEGLVYLMSCKKNRMHLTRNLSAVFFMLLCLLTQEVSAVPDTPLHRGYSVQRRPCCSELRKLWTARSVSAALWGWRRCFPLLSSSVWWCCLILWRKQKQNNNVTEWLLINLRERHQTIVSVVFVLCEKKSQTEPVWLSSGVG